ncbi:MAG: PPC domain-containing DNA-binding protein [Thermoplasmatota archaeon]
MEYRREGNIVVAKFDHGCDLFESLRTLLKEVDREGAIVVAGIGMLKDFKLGYYDSIKDEYQWKEYPEPMELVSIEGSIADDGSIHIHAVVSGEDHIANSGHLKGGDIFNVVEVTLNVFDDIDIKRKLDEDRGSELLSVE